GLPGAAVEQDDDPGLASRRGERDGEVEVVPVDKDGRDAVERPEGERRGRAERRRVRRDDRALARTRRDEDGRQGEAPALPRGVDQRDALGGKLGRDRGGGRARTHA